MKVLIGVIMKKNLINRIIFLLTGSCIISLSLITISAFKDNDTVILSSDNTVSEVISPKIPQEIFLFGEKIPIESLDIYERLERELIVNTYLHSATLLGLKRAARWFPVIEPMLKQNNIPDDFKYLALAESNLDNVISPAGATGYWQFIEASAKKYGLEVNQQVDERYHVEKSTLAACKYLKEAYHKFGSWTMAAAAYNAGFSGIEKWSNIQKNRNFYNLLLNSETSKYIFRIAALKLIHENPNLYGYQLNPSEKYQIIKTKEIVLDSSVTNFANYAISLGINYKILKYLNPWLRDTRLDIKNGKSYTIKIPADGSFKIFSEQ
jgi:hypothetical protein